MTSADWSKAPFEEARDLGTNQSGMRQFNERVVLQIIRRAGSMPKADIARISNLSAQTVSVIINQLLDDELLIKQEKIKGKIGQPSVPIALNQHGAYSIGISIDRHQLEMVLIGFTGEIMNRTAQTYPYPDPQFIFPLIQHSIDFISRSIPAERRDRLTGIGIAAPSFIVGKWEEQLDAPPDIMAQWKNVDIRAQVSKPSGPPVFLAKDSTAACLGELMFGSGLDFPNFLYIFVGPFIGGGGVLNGALYPGVFGNAGAIGSIPLPVFDDKGRLAGFKQLVDLASLTLLEEKLAPLGLDIDQALADDSGKAQGLIDDWCDVAAPSIAQAVASACAVIDFDGIIIDGAMPRWLLDALVEKIAAAMDGLSLDGVVRPWIRNGTIGAKAPILGSALLPLYSNFVPNGIPLLTLPE
ncbi:ROK family transcriptional regulator [Telmatospirillum siberiense]|uniref:ROK family transcriptional regulator n=1 Tax=Telmatospirillum siberiense TaxID=382514 RepID=UPI0013045472|nr:ROK family transcriptional regulator [Telmatospirillum siberiense]